MKIEVYCDGSATTADKAGGWGSVIVIDGALYKELSGHLESATNNDAELEAAIQGLSATYDLLLNRETNGLLLLAAKSSVHTTEVTLISDSEIILGWASGTYRFKQESKILKYNQLMCLMSDLKAQTRWVKGHSGDPYNNRCDKLANDARKGIPSKKLDKISSRSDSKIGSKKTGVVCLWYSGQLKVVDFETGIIENYDREVHGKRGSIIEIREDKVR